MTSESTEHVAATSIGLSLSEATYLDARFLAAQPEYEAMLRWAEIKTSSRVLDAGSGSGAYLPLLCELVGDTGSITALDLTPENVTAYQERARKLKPTCQVKAIAGGIQQLPFGDALFDVVWCANTSQYLSNEELVTTLAEFKRVTRPGGLVVIKEADATGLQCGRIDPAMMWRYLESARQNNSQIAGIMRTTSLPSWVQRAGFANVRSKTFLIERRAPLTSVERIALGDLTEFTAKSALNADLPESDLSRWQHFLGELSEANLLDNSDFFIREAAVVVAGEVM